MISKPSDCLESISFWTVYDIYIYIFDYSNYSAINEYFCWLVCHFSLFQHYNLYQFMFTHTQAEEIIGTDVSYCTQTKTIQHLNCSMFGEYSTVNSTLNNSICSSKLNITKLNLRNMDFFNIWILEQNTSCKYKCHLLDIIYIYRYIFFILRMKLYSANITKELYHFPFSNCPRTILHRAHHTRRSGRNSRPISAEVTLPKL